MPTPQQTEQTRYRSALTQIVGSLLVTVTAVHIAIGLADHAITALSCVLLVVTAAVYAWLSYQHRVIMRRIRYGAYLPHLAGYIIVVGSYHLHAAYLQISDQADLIGANWKGALFGMGGFWGLGLLIHTVATISTKGFEDVEI